MINSDLDLSRWRAELTRRGRTQIADYLQPEAAGALQQCLATQVPWTLAFTDVAGPRTLLNPEYTALSALQVRALLDGCYARARGAYQFAYDSYMMVRAYKEGRDPALLLNRILEFFNSPDYLAFARTLTGEPKIRRVNAQATRYRPGHFLKRHDDQQVEEGRLYAYVINLTREWQADWGGLLQFLDGEGRVVETFMPRWNTLSVFRVPAMHAVSLVAPWAQQDRLAITGWFLS